MLHQQVRPHCWDGRWACGGTFIREDVQRRAKYLVGWTRTVPATWHLKLASDRELSTLKPWKSYDARSKLVEDYDGETKKQRRSIRISCTLRLECFQRMGHDAITNEQA